MDRTGLNAAPVQKALKGIKKYKYILLTALLGVLLLLPQEGKHQNLLPTRRPPRKTLTVRHCKKEMETILSSLDGVGRLSLMLTVEGGGVYELAQDESASLKSCGEEVDERTKKTETVVLGSGAGRGGRCDPQPLSALCRCAHRL